MLSLAAKPASRLRVLLVGCLATGAAIMAPSAHAATTPGSLSFTNTSLTNQLGLSEPAISINAGGTMAITGLQWDFNPNLPFGTNFWTGPFGSTPTFQGLLDDQLFQPGKSVFGSGDADVDFGSTGTVHATTLLFFLNKQGKSKLGVAAVSCPNAASPTFSVGTCTRTIIDTAGADRPWVTSDGPHVYISYHDAGNSSLIHMQRSDDDGVTWKNVADPVVGQGRTTANATFNNEQGRLTADPFTHNVYDVYAAGETGVLKAHTFTPNHIIVSRSTDMGKSWTANTAYTAPPGTSLANIFPTMTVDPTNGHLYAAWSDGQTVWLSSSSDQASHWSTPVAVNIAPASSALFPALAAYGGTVDVAYYGTTDADTQDTAAVWNTYLAQTTNDGASFTQSVVSSHPNHVGPICTGGTACTTGTRNLLDLFEVAIDPQNGRAAVIYVDDTIDTTPAPDFSCLPGETTCPLPQLQLGTQN